jgi:hypothetical protein
MYESGWKFIHGNNPSVMPCHAASISSSHWRGSRQHGPLKHWYPTISINSIITQKTIMWNITWPVNETELLQKYKCMCEYEGNCTNHIKSRSIGLTCNVIKSYKASWIFVTSIKLLRWNRHIYDAISPTIFHEIAKQDKNEHSLYPKWKGTKL